MGCAYPWVVHVYAASIGAEPDNRTFQGRDLFAAIWMVVGFPREHQSPSILALPLLRMRAFYLATAISMLFATGSPSLHAQTSQDIGVTIPVNEAVVSDLSALTTDARPDSMQEWLDTVHFVTNVPRDRVLYVAVSGPLNGGGVNVETVPGSSVAHEHQASWSLGMSRPVRFERPGEQRLIIGLGAVYATAQIRIRLTPGSLAPGPLRIAYRIGE